MTDGGRPRSRPHWPTAPSTRPGRHTDERCPRQPGPPHDRPDDGGRGPRVHRRGRGRLLGALNIPLGSIAILLFALAIRRTAPGFAAVSAVLGVLGLVGTVLSSAGQYADPALGLGLGVGGTERLGGYPGNLWVLLVGLLALAAARADGAVGRADRLPDAP